MPKVYRESIAMGHFGAESLKQTLLYCTAPVLKSLHKYATPAKCSQHLQVVNRETLPDGRKIVRGGATWVGLRACGGGEVYVCV